MNQLSDRAVRLILDAEGINQPGKWPGGASGITIGYGYDLGYNTVDAFHGDWATLVQDDVIRRLTEVVGLRGLRARNRAATLADIRFTGTTSRKVFDRRTVPRLLLLTTLTFPGVDDLPLDAQGALASLVYNRGSSMVDTPAGSGNRAEMRAVRRAVARRDLAGIAFQIRSMKRLWIDKHLDGLIARREAEAALVESAMA